MTGRLWPAAVIAVAATVVAVPTGVSRRRTHRVLGPPQGETGPAGTVRRLVDRLRRWLGFASPVPTRVAVPAVALAGTGALGMGGLVAAFVTVAYGALLVRGLRRHRTAGFRARQRLHELDALCALAADLRAGLPPEALTEKARTRGTLAEGAVGTPGGLAVAAVRLAESTGAPLAELIERIEEDSRVVARAASTAAAQAAGVRATALLLAALPLGGIALGYGIGADPLRVLLHTPVGAVCAVAAVLLQSAGLAWADRLARGSGGA